MGQLVAGILGVLLLIGLVASLASDEADSPVEPLTRAPIVGDYVCSETRSDLHDGVDEAVVDAQREVDRLIAESPELAPYAGAAKAQLRQSAPQAREYLDDALEQNGC